MDVRKLILNTLQRKKEVRTSEIVKATGFSRAYVNRFFQELRSEGRILLLGKANKVRYIKAGEHEFKHAKKKILTAHRILQNKGLSEDLVLDDIKKKSGIFFDIPENVSAILDYAFSEMLNNAIEHSKSKTIEISMRKEKNDIVFSVVDRGVGIFNNIMKKKKLQNSMEAIQDLLKGKQTTAPQLHSGEGIFFTSKMAKMLTIQSLQKKLIFNNILNDVFIEDIKKCIGTKVTFDIDIGSKKKINDIFKQFTDASFEFNKTEVIVKLYKMGSEYISRSQARRIISGLDKFKTVTLDFKNVKTIGQAFADELFRVWKTRHPKITIITKNANENAQFMIKKARQK